MHSLPARMATELMTSEGWRVIHLGSAMPVAKLRYYLAEIDADVVGVSVTLATNLPGAARTVRAARQAGYSVICGGGAFDSSGARARAIGAHGQPGDLTEPLVLDEVFWGEPRAIDMDADWAQLESQRVEVVRDALSWLGTGDFADRVRSAHVARTVHRRPRRDRCCRRCRNPLRGSDDRRRPAHLARGATRRPSAHRSRWHDTHSTPSVRSSTSGCRAHRRSSSDHPHLTTLIRPNESAVEVAGHTCATTPCLDTADRSAEKWRRSVTFERLIGFLDCDAMQSPQIAGDVYDVVYVPARRAARAVLVLVANLRPTRTRRPRAPASDDSTGSMLRPSWRRRRRIRGHCSTTTRRMRGTAPHSRPRQPFPSARPEYRRSDRAHPSRASCRCR